MEQIINFKGEPIGDCPNYFKKICSDISYGRKCSFAIAGYHLSIHINDMFSEDEFALTELETLGNDTSIYQWFGYYLPNCMALVPKKRVRMFLKGFRMALDENRI